MKANRTVAKKQGRAPAEKSKRPSTSGRKTGGALPAKKLSLNRSNAAVNFLGDRLHAVYEQSPLSTQVFSTSGDALMTNHAWEELWGSRREQLKGYNVLADPQVKARGLLPYFEKALQGEVVSIPPVYYDPAQIGQKGRARWTKAMVYPVRDSTGKVCEIVLTHEDVTERQQAEESISRNYQQLLSFVEQAPLSIAMFDLNMNYLAVSRRWISEYGRGYKDLIGRNHYDIHPDLPEIWKDAHRRGLAGESLKNDEDLWIQANGTRNWLRWAITPWTDENRNIGGIIISAEDITARKLAEENIRQYADIVGNMKIGLYVFHMEDREDDRTLRLVTANPSALLFSGVTEEEVLGKTLDESFYDLREKGIPQKYAEVIRTQRAVELEVVYYDDAQQPETVYAVKAFPLPNDHLGVAFENITERRRAEDELKRSHSLLNATLESTADGILVVDSNGNISGYNRKFLDLWRIPEDLASQKDDRILLEYVLNQLKDSSAFLAKVEALYASPEATSFDELEFLDGRVFERYSQPQRMGDNNLGRVWSFRDITGRKQAEEKLHGSEKRFRALIEHGSDEISLLAADGSLLYESPSSNPTLGYAPGEFLGRNMFQLVHPDDIERVQRQFSDLSKKPGESLRDQFRLRHKSGAWRWVEAVGTNLLDEPAVRAVVVNYHDITERKKAEEALKESELRYRGLFEDSPVSIWEEDFSQVKAYFDHLRSTGVTDFRDYFERHPEAVIECIGRIQVLDVNRTTLDLMMVKDKDELLASLSESLNEDAISTVKLELISLAEGNLSYEGDEIFENRKGEKRNIFFRLSVAPGYEDTLGRVFFSFIDITDRKLAETALRESEQRHRAVFENTPVAIWEEDFSEVKRYVDALKENGISDLRGYFKTNPAALRECMDMIRILDVNEKAVQLFEAESKEELIHSSSEEPSKVEFEHNAEDFALIAEGVTHSGWEGEDTTLKGRPIIIHLRWSVVPGREADYSRVIVTTVDITEQKLAEAELRESRARYRSLFENSPISLWEEDFSEVKRYFDQLRSSGISDFREYFEAHPDAVMHCARLVEIVDVNRATLSFMNASDKSSLIARLSELLSNDALPPFQSELINLAEGKLSYESDGTLTTGNGVQKDIFLRASVAPGYEDTLGKVFVSIVDITERKQAEEQVRRSEQRYHALFEDSPISIWEEDFSSAKKYLDDLKAQGFTDLRSYFQTNPEAISHCASLIQVLDVNNAALRMYRAETKAELIEATQRVLSQGDQQHNLEDFVAISEGRTSNFWEGGDETLSGEPIEISLRWSVAPGHEDDYSKVIVTVIDVTDRNEAVKQLQQSEERFRLLASNIQEVFWIYDPVVGKDTYLSPAYEEIWGRRFEDQLQNHNFFIENILPEDRQHVLRMIEKQRGGDRTEMEYRIQRPDGSIRWIWDRAFPIVDDSQKVKFITGIAADITERKKAESETLRHLDELQALYENGLAVGRLLTTREIGERVIQTFTQYLSWHHATIRLRKGGSDELELVAFSVPHMTEEKKADVERNFNAHITKVGQGMSGWVVQTGTPVRTGNVHAYPQYVDTYEGIRSGMYMPLKVGDQIIGSISVESELPDAFTLQDERLLATLATQAAVAFENARLYQAIQQELGERRRAETMLERERNSLARRVEERTAELISANSNLARALRVKDEFLANMSHELRTPLNAILGLSESLGEQVAGSLNDKQQKYVQTITESGHHLLALINDILDLAKIEAGQVTLDISRVDVHSLCQSSLRMVRQLAQKKNQEVLLEIDENFGLIWADERRLKQMIVNLLSNAVKFTPEDGKLGLEVHGDKDENRVLITVWDNGIGIAEDDIAKLFQPFVQLSTGLARESSGTGLGLALVAQMARLHGGGVSVSSLHGGGSRFTLVLPWEPALAVDTMERMKITGKFRAVRNISEHERRTILLIEDTPEVVMMVRDYLEVAGYNVAVAEDGLEGISQAKRTHPDLILMDLQMPRMDGFEATRNLRSDPAFKTTPIIALTALAMQGDRERCLAAGMDEYITKPVNLKGLVKIIEACLTQPQEEIKPEMQ